MTSSVGSGRPDCVVDIVEVSGAIIVMVRLQGLGGWREEGKVLHVLKF
jgi:hypothetical protein